MNKDILARTLVAEVSISRIPFLVRNASSLLSGFGSKKSSQAFLPGNIEVICPDNMYRVDSNLNLNLNLNLNGIKDG